MLSFYKRVGIILFTVVLCLGVIPVTVFAKEVKSPFDNMVVANVTSKLNVREKASTTSKIVGTMDKGSVGTILQKGKTFTKIQSGNVTGYVSNQYILTGNEMESYVNKNISQSIVVNTSVLKVRKKSSVNAEELTKIYEGKKYPVISVGIKWVKIKINNTIGYVSKEYVNLEYDYTYAAKMKEPEVTTSKNETNVVGDSYKSSDQLRKEMTEYALQFEGNPYVYGGTSLTEGADCSGFILTIYQKFGIPISRTSRQQFTEGREIEIGELKAGDLIFYGSKGVVGHVAMYIGDNKVIQALNAKKGICITSVTFDEPMGARTLIEEW